MIMKSAGTLLILVLFCYACGNKNLPPKTHKQAIAEEGFVEDTLCGMYKRYTGTIAGQPVVVHYTKYGSTIRCEYYYENIGQIISLFNYSDTTNTGLLYLSESSSTEMSEDEAHWEVIVSGDSITGVWATNDKMKIFPIRLKEDYSNGVQHFSIVCMVDSVRFTDSLPQPQAQISYQLLLPVGYDEATGFTRSVIYRSIGCDTTNSANIKSCLENLKTKYFADYRKPDSDVPVDMQTSSFNNWSEMTNYWVVYNENGMVVLNHHKYEFTGGAHGNYASDYLCIDARQLKKLELKDILAGDEKKLIQLLEVEARKRYNAKPGEPLNSYMLVEELHVPEQFYITNKGITFVYGIYEVAAYVEGEINLFIPYSKIMDMLSPAFKQRMGLEVVAKK